MLDYISVKNIYASHAFLRLLIFQVDKNMVTAKYFMQTNATKLKLIIWFCHQRCWFNSTAVFEAAIVLDCIKLKEVRVTLYIVISQLIDQTIKRKCTAIYFDNRVIFSFIF